MTKRALPSPPSHPFQIVPGLRQYLKPTKAGMVWRFHGFDKTKGVSFHPVYFSTNENSRWDFSGAESAGGDSGALCVGRSFAGSMLEVFGKNWPSVLASASAPDFARLRAISVEEQKFTFVSRLRIPAGLSLFDLTETGALSSLGIDSILATTKEYKLTRKWARWFSDCAQIDGLIYSSRPAGAKAFNYVLFNRPGLKANIIVARTKPLIAWKSQLEKAAKTLNFIILADSGVAPVA